MAPIRNIVLVHGGFVDGSGWQGVYDHLTADGYRVAVVQNPTRSLADDVAATRQILDGLDGPAVLVGHSYGVVITEAGTHPNVAALAYISAFAPDEGESVSSLIANPPPGARSRRSCRHRTASCSSTGTASRPPSPPTCPRTWRLSWPTPKSPGASTPSKLVLYLPRSSGLADGLESLWAFDGLAHVSQPATTGPSTPSTVAACTSCCWRR